MSKLNIHRDQPQPSDEQLLKHKDFDAVLNGANVGTTAAGGSTISFWSNPILWIGGIVVVTGTFLIWNMNNPSAEISSTNTSSEDTQTSPPSPPEQNSITIATNTDTLTDIQSISVPQTNHTTTENIDKETSTLKTEKNSSNSRPDTSEKIELKEADGKVFKLSSAFNLTANFDEFEAYDQVSFQPIDKVNPSYLETAWDSAFLEKTELGYQLTLHKNNKAKTFQVKPTL